MNQLFFWVIMGLLFAIVGIAVNRRAEKADKDPANQAKVQELEAKYAAICGENESLITICRGDKNAYYILTSERLIIDKGDSSDTILLNTVNKVKAKEMSGRKAITASRCGYVEIFTDKKYTLYKMSANFEKIAAYFMGEKIN